MKYRFFYNRPFKFFRYRIVSYYFFILEWLTPKQNIDHRQIPIIINNFNRLCYLKQLIESLEKRGYTNLYIIDNLSTYPPLLKYYDSLPYTVFRLNKNIGNEALWRSHVFRKFRKSYFVYTDPDVIPIEECPDDFMLVFLNALKKYRFARKVGFSLKIDDLPDSYSHKEEVINHEKQFFNYKQDELLFWAPIDTTFALYRPWGRHKHGFFDIEMYRTAHPYMARHAPWYADCNNLNEEDTYYHKNSKTSTHWTHKSRRKEKISEQPIEFEN
jgi:hypothetical protein